MRVELPFTSLETLPLDGGSKKRLSSYLARIKRDEEKPLFDNRVVKEALKYSRVPRNSRKILARLSSCKSKTDGLRFGRSCGRYDSMLSIWEKFASPDKPDLRWSSRFRAAIQKVSMRYAEARLRVLPLPTSVEEARELLPEWRTSGGWESICTGKRYKGEILDKEYIASLPSKVAKAVEDGRFCYPIIPGFRTQCVELPNGDCKHKKRPVNMVTLAVILIESLYANPINSFLTSYRYSAIGKDNRIDIPKWVHHHQTDWCHYLSLDYSSYDATIPSWLIDAAFGILKQCFRGMTPEQERLWDVLEQTFIVKDLVTPEGILHVTHGNPSGSKFTAIINGVCNEIMTEYWADMLGRKVDYMIMGDDNLIYFMDGGPITDDEIEQIASLLTHKIGVKVNADKTEHGSYKDDPKFLSCEWRENGAWRSHDELLSLLAYPERFRNYSGTQLTPELILYSYILGCEAGMSEWFKVEEFLHDHPNLRKIPTSKEVLRELPYTVRVRAELEVIDCAPKLLTA